MPSGTVEDFIATSSFEDAPPGRPDQQVSDDKGPNPCGPLRAAGSQPGGPGLRTGGGHLRLWVAYLLAPVFWWAVRPVQWITVQDVAEAMDARGR